MNPRTRLLDEIDVVVTGRLLWAVLPSRQALRLRGSDQLGEMVTWAVSNVAADIEEILKRYDIQLRGSTR